jgi:hypothetical protein
LAERWFARRFNRGKLSPYFNQVYFVEWAAIITILAIATSQTSGVPQLVIVAIALWRVAEILIGTGSGGIHRRDGPHG